MENTSYPTTPPHILQPTQPTTVQAHPASTSPVNALELIQHIHFIGVAGTGMSAIAQYLAGQGKSITGSDRYFLPDGINHTQQQLTTAGIRCFLQDGSGINAATQLVVISTAIENTNPEMAQAQALNIPIVKRAELLSWIVAEKKGIAIAGTSGKSTTTAMLFDILAYAGLYPSIISGAGLVRLQEQGLIGNAQVGKSDYLVIEADESDGSIVHYHPYLGILLNIDKDHKELDELQQLFQTFQSNCQHFITNASHPFAAPFTINPQQDFGLEDTQVGYKASQFEQDGLHIRFCINNQPFTLQAIGQHNMENAVAAVAAAAMLGVSLETCSQALAQYKGIYRRNQVLGNKKGVWVIDDYAHNPAKVAAAIKGVQPLAEKVIAWFQPHGYGPTRFLRKDFVEAITAALRPQDQIWMSEIFYAGGTAVKDISAKDLIDDILAVTPNQHAFFIENRSDLLAAIRPSLTPNTVLLLMGARDPSLDAFAHSVFQEL